MSAQMRRRRDAENKFSRPADGPPVRRRGRPQAAEPDAAISMRADNYRRTLAACWPSLWPGFSKAQSASDVSAAWLGAGLYDGQDGFRFLKVLAPEILGVLKDRRFPKRGSDAQIRFLATSLAGIGRVAARTSRDICARAERQAKRQHTITQAEPLWLIECSCGYTGPSKAMACPTCGAGIPPHCLMEWGFLR